MESQLNVMPKAEVYDQGKGAYKFDTVISKYDPIRTLLLSIKGCYENKIYTFNKEGIFKATDYEKGFQISQKHNPLCYWDLILG